MSADIQHVRRLISNDLDFQKKKLESPVKEWEEGMRTRIQDKIEGLMQADEILKAQQQGRITILPEDHGKLTTND